ncbi:MAG: hypothetical protein AB7O66_19780 [Limisphaerales bacterium]
MSNQSPHPPHPAAPIHPALASPAPKPRRRWWVYVLWIFGSAVGLFLVAVLSAWLYWKSLIRTYTSTSPKPLPTIEATDEQYAALKERWDAYALLFIRRREPIPPFELSADELNLFANRFGPFRKEAHVQILGGSLRLQFSSPLDRTRNPSLQGRYLNGVATFAPSMTNGHLAIRLTAVEANNKPIPRWLLKRFQAYNWGEALNRRPEFDLAIRALDRIELEPDKIILHPGATTGR